jgi:hypothetical protein
MNGSCGSEAATSPQSIRRSEFTPDLMCQFPIGPERLVDVGQCIPSKKSLGQAIAACEWPWLEHENKSESSLDATKLFC